MEGAAPPRGTKKPRKNRRRNQIQKSRGPAGGGALRGPPPAPQTKLTLRGIGNVNTFGTMQSVGTMIRQMIQRANDKLRLENYQTMSMDEVSLTKLITSEQTAAVARLEWERSLKPGNTGDSLDTKEDTEVALEQETAQLVAGVDELSVAPTKTSKSTSDPANCIVAKILYVVPPKSTRRRGEKPGNAYVMLTTPPLESVKSHPTTAVPRVAEDTSVASARPSESIPPPTILPILPVDYSREVAQRRLALLRAVEAMEAVALEDAKTQQMWMGCVVAESEYGKTWKSYPSGDRLEGTITETPAYREFLESQQRIKEERENRPKPLPGGGVGSVTTVNAGTDGTGQSVQMPVAALVQHLQAKRIQEKHRQKAPQKAKSKTTKKEPTAVSNGKKVSEKKKNPKKKKKAKQGPSVVTVSKPPAG
jgi:hypothetical protein